MYKPTEIIISDDTQDIGDLGVYPYDLSVTKEDFKKQVRKLLLRRKGKNPSLLSELENISNSSVEKIIGPDGSILFEVTKEDIAAKNIKAQIYMGLVTLISNSHTKNYKEGDCSDFLYHMLGVKNIFIRREKVNFDKFKISFIPPSLNGKVTYEIGDALVLCRGSNITLDDIDKQTGEVQNPDIVFEEHHFAVCIGGGFFISKYGKFQKFCIGTIEEMGLFYSTQQIFCLEQRDLEDSSYIQEL